MKLRLDLDDIEVIFKIKWWRKSGEPYYDYWCKVDLCLTSPYLNYKRDDDEMLMCCEVEDLEDLLGKLISNALEEDTEIAFIEPDLEFKFETAKTIHRDGWTEHSNIFGELIVNFWCKDGSLGCNHLHMGMAIDDLVAMHKYLQLVTGKIEKTDPTILDLIDKGVLIS